jgi:hypothetical protein
MRLLIHECVDERLRLSFPDHDCQEGGKRRKRGQTHFSAEWGRYEKMRLSPF